MENPVDLDLVELPETERKGVEASVSQLALKPPVEAPIPLESPVPEPELLVVESTPVPQAPQEVSPKSPLVEGTEPPAFTSELSLVPAEARPPELVPSSSLPRSRDFSPSRTKPRACRSPCGSSS
ncbi:hypothetical protein MASR2M78_31730 [Treponema sp.]